MTDPEKDAWDAMLTALERCAVILPVGDGILTQVEHAVALAVKSQEPER
jgi:hypothetical protein